MTAAEKRYLNTIASLPCIVCGSWPVEIHHVRRFGETRKHNKAVPLCVNHHRGAGGLHTLGKKEFERRFMSQSEMLKVTAERLK